MPSPLRGRWHPASHASRMTDEVLPWMREARRHLACLPARGGSISRRDALIPPCKLCDRHRGIWGNGTFPLPAAEEGKVPFPQPRLWRAVA